MKDIINSEAEIRHHKYKIKLARRRVHKDMLVEYKVVFRIMDVMFVLFILMNFGALMLTDALVTKKRSVELKEQGKELVFTEVNRAQAEFNDFETLEDLDMTPQEYNKKKIAEATMIMSFLRQSFLWGILIAVYLYYRFTIYTTKQLYIMLGLVSIYFSILGWDFWHDAGLFLGSR